MERLLLYLSRKTRLRLPALERLQGGVGDYKTFRQIGRERLLHGMLRPSKVKKSKSTQKELIEKLSKGELQTNEYPYMNEPTPIKQEGLNTSASTQKGSNQAPHSMKSRRTPTWAKERVSDAGNSSESADFKRMGQRIFVFIIGGATRSELRTAHELTGKVRREVILGSSSFDDPPQFITKLKLLSSKEVSGLNKCR